MPSAAAPPALGFLHVSHPWVSFGRPLPGRVSYLLGSDPRRWVRDVPTYGSVTYHHLWPGIDLLLSGASGRLSSHWLLHPGANPARIRLRPASLAPTSLAGQPIRIERRANLLSGPVIGYAVYLGGSAADFGEDVAVDGSGSAYVIGTTVSLDFPVVGGLPGGRQSGTQTDDVFVTKLNPSGTAIVYSTYLGGEDEEEGAAIAVDGRGDAYLAGYTRSSQFPIVAGTRCNRSPVRSGDAFTAELNRAGKALLYSTCLGGSATDWASHIAVDRSGEVYVLGSTSSSDFPTSHPYQAHTAGNADLFLVKLRNGRVVFSTYFGGSGDDEGTGLAVDSSGDVFLTGSTESVDFPVHNAAQSSYGGGSNRGPGTGDAFVVEMSPQGVPIYSTYLGGAGDDGARAVAVDAAGNAYVVGLTDSSDFPVMHPYQRTNHGGTDAFVVKVSADGRSLLFGTYLGGSDREAATAVAVDGKGNVDVAGSTASADFPTAHAVQPTYAGGYFDGDAFVTQLNASGQTLLSSTYLGGKGDDIAIGLALDRSGAIYLVGGTSSTDFPVTGGLAGTNPQRGNAFVLKLVPAPVDALTPSSRPAIVIDQIALLHQVERQNMRATAVLLTQEQGLFVVVYHEANVTPGKPAGSIWFTGNGRTLARSSMIGGSGSDRRPDFYLRRRFSAGDIGTVTAHIRVVLGTATTTRSLHFRVVSKPQHLRS